MFKYLINVFVLLASFGCKANLPEPSVLLKCNLESGSGRPHECLVFSHTIKTSV
jgi:hypothetical protein